jgi:hypothetical protein
VFWSNPANWPNSVLPGEDEIVEIPKGRTMILDIPETPIFKNLQINGVLRFKQGMDIHLRSKIIFVRAGELQIGTEAVPFTNKATITLFGDSESEPMAWSNSVEGGNKMIANVGKISMFGKQRMKMSRLRTPAKKGDTKIFVEDGLDWLSGDKIAVASTSYNHEGAEEFVIQSYNF